MADLEVNYIKPPEGEPDSITLQLTNGAEVKIILEYTGDWIEMYDSAETSEVATSWFTDAVATVIANQLVR